jgi:hypothetical protein
MLKNKILEKYAQVNLPAKYHMENTHHSTVTAWRSRLFILLLPYCRNRKWLEAFHRTSDMNRPGETILRKVLRANDKTAWRIEVCPVSGDESLPLSSKTWDYRGIVERNSRFRVGSIAATLHNTTTRRHNLSQGKLTQKNTTNAQLTLLFCILK